MIRIRTQPLNSGELGPVQEFTYQGDDLRIKVLANGACKITRVTENEIPPLGASKDQKIKFEEVELVVAIFNCNYVLETPPNN